MGSNRVIEVTETAAGEILWLPAFVVAIFLLRLGWTYLRHTREQSDEHGSEDPGPGEQESRDPESGEQEPCEQNLG